MSNSGEDIVPDDKVYRIKPLFEMMLVKAQECALKLSFNIAIKQQRTGVCLFCRIIEISHSINCLLNNKFSPVRVGIPILLRNLFEGYVDLKCSLRDAEYVESLDATFLKQKKKITEQAINRNKYTSGLDEYLDLDGELKSINQQIAKMKENSINPSSIYKKFEKAELDQEYRTIYGLLCGSAHNELGTLGRRHLTKDAKGNSKLLLFEEITIEEQIPYILTVVGLLLGAIDLVQEFFSTEIVIVEERTEFLLIKEHFEKISL